MNFCAVSAPQDRPVFWVDLLNFTLLGPSLSVGRVLN